MNEIFIKRNAEGKADFTVWPEADGVRIVFGGKASEGLNEELKQANDTIRRQAETLKQAHLTAAFLRTTINLQAHKIRRFLFAVDQLPVWKIEHPTGCDVPVLREFVDKTDLKHQLIAETFIFAEAPPEKPDEPAAEYRYYISNETELIRRYRDGGNGEFWDEQVKQWQPTRASETYADHRIISAIEAQEKTQ